MASGDIFSNYNISVGTGGVSVQPAGSTVVCITGILCNNTNCSFTFGGNNYFASDVQDDLGKFPPTLNTKLFIDNAFYIGFKQQSGSGKCGYSGIEI
jgi:hypothetical protein|tara:strand:- start:731 stop:1021 length:291 start_codon:yes stop_codon:yes gene_type:complete